MTDEQINSAANYKSIALKLAAFCAQLSCMEDVPQRVAREGNKLAREFKEVDKQRNAAGEGLVPDQSALAFLAAHDNGEGEA